MIFGDSLADTALRTSIPWVGTKEHNYHVSSPPAHSMTAVIMNGLPQQASALCQLPENLGEVIHVAMSPIPRVCGEIMCSGLFYETRVLAEGIHTTGTQGGEQSAIFPILEIDGPSCEATGNPHLQMYPPVPQSINAAFLVVETSLGSCLGEVIAGGCPSVWGTLAGRIHCHDDDCPNRIW